MKEEGNYRLVPTNKLEVHTRFDELRLTGMNKADHKRYEDRIISDLEFKIYVDFRKFIANITDNDRYFVLGEFVTSTSVDGQLHVTRLTTEAWIYEVHDIDNLFHGAVSPRTIDIDYDAQFLIGPFSGNLVAGRNREIT